jgi:aminoglycoside phosphotransferase (APT) family kinase protein
VTQPRMHADEVEIDAGLVRRLLVAQFPEWAELPIEPVLPWGTDNALYRLGDGMVARLPRHAPKVAPLEKELQWLPRLAPRLPLAVPVPLAEGRPGNGYPFPWTVYEWLPGENATLAPITDEVRLATDLVGFIAALQRIDSSGAPEPSEKNVYRGAPLVLRDESTRASIAQLATTIDAPRVSAVWDAALEAPEWEAAPVWIHGDLDGRNLLVVAGRLSAVIDWGCLGVGDPAYDVMVAWKMVSGDARELFRAELDVDDDTWRRGRGLVASQAVIALSYYTLETNPVLVREAERWLAEVLAESG